MLGVHGVAAVGVLEEVAEVEGGLDGLGVALEAFPFGGGGDE